MAIKKTALGLKASVNGTSVEVPFYSPKIIRVVKVPETKEGLSVLKKPQQHCKS